MKYFSSLFLIILFAIPLFLLSNESFADKGFTETELQQRFANSVQSLPEVIQASWQSQLDLWVYGDGVDKEGAQELALKVIMLSQTEYGQGLCVHVHNGNYESLATKCSQT